MKRTYDVTFRVELVDFSGNFSEVNFGDSIADAMDYAIDCSEMGCQDIVLLDSNNQDYAIH